MSLQTGSVTSWHFPLAYSKSTINGQTGSNACTFIVLVLSKLHCAAPKLPRPHHPLSLTWVFRMVQGMEIGNKFYDSHSAGDPVMFGVREAVQKFQASLGITSVRSELPADITSGNSKPTTSHSIGIPGKSDYFSLYYRPENRCIYASTFYY